MNHNGPVKVTDNSPLDLDQSDGQFMAKSPNGTSTVCPFALAYPSCGQFMVKGAYDPMVSVGFVSDWL